MKLILSLVLISCFLTVIFGNEVNITRSFVELKEFPEELGNEILKEHNARGGRIVVGSAAGTNQFPYFGYLVLYRSDFTTFCGSALISTGWVVTAAHCMAYVVGAQVYFGSTDKQNTQTSRSVRRFVVHQDYQFPTPLANDIALMELTSPVALSYSVKVIPLPTRSMFNKNYSSMTLTACGFGKTNSGYPRYMQYAYLNGVSNSQCLAVHWVFRTSMLCAKSSYGSSVCFGDSGGPLSNRYNNIDYLVGVTSYVETGQCYWDTQGFTRVDNYLDWISGYTRIPISL